MPLYNSQVVSNSPLQAVTPDQTVPVALHSAETPASGAASIAAPLMARTANAEGFRAVSVSVSCPAGLGAGVMQIQDSDSDAAANYCSIGFGGANPGQVVAANQNASGVARVELLIRGKFLRVLWPTGPSNPVTVTVE